ncbi:unnamed protein product [Linum tenue]|uniref:Uncharacterized protein n=1 Tax=Linum tenue TaxID=586396 RepID=A0AAV0M1J2_9ROSI|nr:unnamed protein product [Linum tenue]
MAYNLCASASSLYQPLWNSLSSPSRDPKPKPSTYYFIKLPTFPPQSKPSSLLQLTTTHVSLHDTVPQQSAKEEEDVRDPNGKSSWDWDFVKILRLGESQKRQSFRAPQKVIRC